MDYYDISPSVTAFSTTRHGGFSHGAYGSFNINRYCGDDDECIKKNLDLLCRKLGVDENRIIMPHQTHGNEVRLIGEDFLTLPQTIRTMILEGVDALATDVRNTCIGVSTADCIPILIYDAAHHAVAAVHAGWRSTLRRIPVVALQAMEKAYGTRPSEVKVAVGPGISLEAFEVGDEVYEAFSAAGFPMQEMARRFPVRGADGMQPGKWHLDLWRANTGLLEQAGVPEGHIHVAGICTYANADRFFSARRLGIRSGRILNGIFLKDGLK